MPRRRRPSDLAGFVRPEFSAPPTIDVAPVGQSRWSARLVAVLALIALFSLVVIAVAAASEHPVKACTQYFSQREHAVYVHAVYHRESISRAARRRMANMILCRRGGTNPAKAAANMRRVQALAGRARARRLSLTPYLGPNGTRWAIPWPIVNCESHGKNEPPNSAGASGYYQFIPGTWQSVGGSGQAYEHPKAEQDKRAHILWTTEPHSHWDCTAIVGWGR